MTRRSATALLLALFLSMGAILPQLLVGALAVDIQATVGISNAWFGAMVSAYFLTAAIMAKRCGALVRRLGWPTAAMWSTTLVIVALAVIAARPSLLLLGLMCGGVAWALAATSGNVVLARYAREDRKGLLFGIRQTGPPAASLLAGLGVGIAIALGSWRWSLALGAILPAATLAFALYARSRLDGGAAQPDAAAEPKSDQQFGQLGERAEPPASAPDSGGGEWRRQIHLLTLAGSLGTISVSSTTSFIGRGLDGAGLQAARVGSVIIAISVAGIVARVVAGWFADRRRGAVPWLLGGMMWVGALGFVLMSTGRTNLVVAGALLAYAGGWGWAGLIQFSAVQTGAASVAEASSILQRGLSIGAALGPVTFGWVVDQVSIDRAWLMLMVASLIGGIIAVVGGRGSPASRHQDDREECPR